MGNGSESQVAGGSVTVESQAWWDALVAAVASATGSSAVDVAMAVNILRGQNPSLTPGAVFDMFVRA